MIHVQDLEFRYRASPFLLAIGELKIAAGQHAAITGQSGCGKTTLLRLLSGLEMPTVGSIAVDNQELTGCNDRQLRLLRNQKIGHVFQDFRLIEYLSIRDNILLPVMLSAEPVAESHRVWLEELCQATGIDQLPNHAVATLSRGELQRVAVCRALIRKPAYLFADEPTASLDPENSERVWDLLFCQADRIGSTIVAVTHERSSLKRFDQVVDFAQLVAGGTNG